MVERAPSATVLPSAKRRSRSSPVSVAKCPDDGAIEPVTRSKRKTTNASTTLAASPTLPHIQERRLTVGERSTALVLLPYAGAFSGASDFSSFKDAASRQIVSNLRYAASWRGSAVRQA